MSVRTSLIPLLVACLGSFSANAFAQQSSATDTRKWEMEVHAGGVWAGRPSGGTVAMPAPGDTFTTSNGRASRYVSSWYFGDGAALLNQWAAAFTNIPRSGRIAPLDPVLTEAAARPSHSGSFGFRIGRSLSPRFTAELNVDYGATKLELAESALADIEATRNTFATVWNEATGAPFVNPTISSASDVDEGTGGEIVATGALTAKLKRSGALIPYVTGGLGGMFSHGGLPTVTLKGNYSMGVSGIPQLDGQVPPGTLVTYSEADTVTVRFVRPNRTLVGVVGGGFIHDVSERHGFRVDLRLHLRPNVADTEINASPAVSTRTAAATLSSGTTPSVQFSNTGSPAARSTLSGPALTEFKTRDGSGVQIDTALSAGYFWRF